ncbi:MAG: hypothetical protein JSV04_12470 [Candidatus Heimdallarchaeota archaeon]|nr:MAG: hypothetical protein JSV04_12470 [Candidatus Heimdallarchaeota archaeon]
MIENKLEDFVFQNYKLALKKVRNLIYITLSLKNLSEWQDCLILPHISLENDLTIYPSEVVKKESSKEHFYLMLENDSIDCLNFKMEIMSNKLNFPWIHIKITLFFVKKYVFNFAPEIKMTLLPKTDYASGVSINQPTYHTPKTDEWKSNDMPAAYVWNYYSGVETFVFVDFSNMNWMSPETFERFSVYECGSHPDGGFGLLNRGSSKVQVEIPANFKMNFDLFLSLDHRKEQPSEWEAIEALVSRCFKLIPGHIPFPRSNLRWHRFSEGCINDLMKKKLCWIDSDSPKYHAYVMDTSEIQRRKTIGRTDVFETMTLLDILPPWILHLILHKDRAQQEHVKNTSKGLIDFIDQSSNFLYNNIQIGESFPTKIVKPTKSSIGDSWYFFEPIARLGWFIILAPLISDDLDYSSCFEEMVNKAIEFTQHHNYEISAFYDPITFKPLKEELDRNPKRKQLLCSTRGEKDVNWKTIAKNYSCLGIYIYLLTQAYHFFNKDYYLMEAIKAAKKYMIFSPNELFWEPLEIAYGAAGLAELYRITEDERYLKNAYHQILNELRMFYWYEDNSFDWKGKRSNLGLVMACVGIRYPAMKENLESTYPWLIFLKLALRSGKTSLLPKGLLKFFNLIRINSFNYFSNVLPKELIYPDRQKSPCQFIPFEDLEMLETPSHFSDSQIFVPKGRRTGVLGREIYGAGEVIWLYLMFEALALCDNENIMILNLDLFDFLEMKVFPPKRLTFIAFNPFLKNQQGKITLKTIEHGNWMIKIKSLDYKEKEFSFEIDANQAKDGIMLEFEEGEVLSVELFEGKH